MNAYLSWPFLGYYGPQSGIVFDEAPEADDYAETEEEMLYVLGTVGNVNEYNIRYSENLGESCGTAEIEEYFKAARKHKGGVFTGSSWNGVYRVGFDGNNWVILYLKHNEEPMVIYGTLKECVDKFVKAMLD